jgi:hypothetical protein
VACCPVQHVFGSLDTLGCVPRVRMVATTFCFLAASPWPSEAASSCCAAATASDSSSRLRFTMATSYLANSTDPEFHRSWCAQAAHLHQDGNDERRACSSTLQLGDEHNGWLRCRARTAADRGLLLIVTSRPNNATDARLNIRSLRARRC